MSHFVSTIDSRDQGAKAINVAILMLIIFNSGGIKIFDHFYVTIATLFLLAIKLAMERRFSITAFTTAIVFSSMLLLFNLVATNSWSGIKEYAVFLSYLVTAALLLSSYHASNDSFTSDLYLALKLFLCHSVLSFLFQFIGKSFLFSIDRRVKTFYYLFYYMFENKSFVSRNQGFFWEPGVLQLYLNLLFYIAYFIKKNLRVSSLAALAVFTTFSTTGYLILVLLVLSAFLHRIRRSKLALFGMLILLPMISIPVFMNVQDKFTGENAKSASVRMFDIAVGTSLLIDHPLVGVGLDQKFYNEVFYSYGIDKIKDYGIEDYELEGKGITNSVLFMATAFGLPIAILLMFFLYKQSLVPGPKGLLFLLFFLSGLSEPIFNTVFFSILFVSGFLSYTKFKVPIMMHS